MRCAPSWRRAAFASRWRSQHEPIWVDGDPARLQQIQVNLLSNAAKYTPAGGHVAAGGRARGRGGRHPGERRRRRHSHGDARIDLRAVRAVDAHPRSIRAVGSASGSRWCARSWRMHGGMVTVTSAGEGKGASSWCGCRSRPSFRSVTPRRPNRGRVRAFGAGAKVVVVEDNADSRELLCELLAAGGIRVRHRRKRPGRAGAHRPDPSRDRHPRRRAARDGRLRAGAAVAQQAGSTRTCS